MPSFNGVDLGLVEEMTGFANPNERQINAYPGIDWLEVLDMGSRGGQTSCKGVLAADSPADLFAVMASLHAQAIGHAAATLVDLFGNSWTNVDFTSFRPVGPASRFGDGTTACYQRYEAEFLHTVF